MTNTTTEATALDNTARKISDKDIRNVAIRWLFSNTAAWNYERMQNVAFAWSLAPVLKRLYTTKEELGAALSRHMAFFNTHMTVGAAIIGVTAAMEEQRSEGEDIPDSLFDAIKSGLMGPLAAIGDSLYGSTFNAVLLSVCMSLAMTGNVAGPVIFAVVWAVSCAALTIAGVRLGYRQGMDVLDSDIFSEDNISTVTRVLSILGLVVIGGLTAGFVSLTTPLQWGSGDAITTLQSVFDSLMPGLLPFIVVIVSYYLLDKKNLSVLGLLGILVLIGTVGSLTGILG